MNFSIISYIIKYGKYVYISLGLVCIYFLCGVGLNFFITKKIENLFDNEFIKFQSYSVEHDYLFSLNPKFIINNIVWYNKDQHGLTDIAIFVEKITLSLDLINTNIDIKFDSPVNIKNHYDIDSSSSIISDYSRQCNIGDNAKIDFANFSFKKLIFNGNNIKCNNLIKKDDHIDDIKNISINLDIEKEIVNDDNYYHFKLNNEDNHIDFLLSISDFDRYRKRNLNVEINKIDCKAFAYPFKIDKGNKFAIDIDKDGNLVGFDGSLRIKLAGDCHKMLDELLEEVMHYKKSNEKTTTITKKIFNLLLYSKKKYCSEKNMTIVINNDKNKNIKINSIPLAKLKSAMMLMQ
ncbi:MAG: hypothetical protein OEY79_03340 [Anaplasmataceae bacterium]|nr:hypothetical protein [Anaplasmataceae bacterium]